MIKRWTTWKTWKFGFFSACYISKNTQFCIFPKSFMISIPSTGKLRQQKNVQLQQYHPLPLAKIACVPPNITKAQMMGKEDFCRIATWGHAWKHSYLERSGSWGLGTCAPQLPSRWGVDVVVDAYPNSVSKCWALYIIILYSRWIWYNIYIYR